MFEAVYYPTNLCPAFQRRLQSTFMLAVQRYEPLEIYTTGTGWTRYPTFFWSTNETSHQPLQCPQRHNGAAPSSSLYENRNNWISFCKRTAGYPNWFFSRSMALKTDPEPILYHSDPNRQHAFEVLQAVENNIHSKVCNIERTCKPVNPAGWNRHHHHMCLHNLKHHISSKLCLVLASHYMLDRTF